MMESEKLQNKLLREVKRKIGIAEAKEDLKKQLQRMSMQEIAQSLKVK